DERADVGFGRDVGPRELDRAGGSGQLIACRLPLAGVAPADQHVRAGIGQRARAGLPDAPAAAGHDRDLAVEAKRVGHESRTVIASVGQLRAALRTAACWSSPGNSCSTMTVPSSSF